LLSVQERADIAADIFELANNPNDYIPLCEISCMNLTVREVFQDMRLGNRL
jgi:hypothetical protein